MISAAKEESKGSGYPNNSLIWSLFTYLPMKMEQTECSKTSAYKIQTPGNYPEGNIQQDISSLNGTLTCHPARKIRGSLNLKVRSLWLLSSRTLVWHTVFFCKSSEALRDVIWYKRLKNWAQNWILCHDSVLCHIFLAVHHFLLKNQIPALPETHSGHHFVSVREIQQHTTAFLAHIPKEHFQRSLQQWLECCGKCVFAEGKYFEGDYIKSLLPQTMPEF